VQPFLSSHIWPLFAGTPPWQTPLRQVSPVVQRLPSSHAPPSLPGTATQVCCASLHWPIMHTSPGAAHVLGSPVHWPATHLSLIVQYRLSSHGVPSFTGITLQPICGSQNPTEQVPLRNEQSTMPPAMQLPPWQVPGSVHASLSTQDAPSLPG